MWELVIPNSVNPIVSLPNPPAHFVATTPYRLSEFYGAERIIDLETGKVLKDRSGRYDAAAFYCPYIPESHT